MLQETILRLKDIKDSKPLITISNKNHRFMVAEQIWELGVKSQNIILEPMGKNTAPAIIIAALNAQQNDTDDVLLVLPSDHVIANSKEFNRAVNTAIIEAENGNMVTFGIVPTGPETGYGYIKQETDKSTKTQSALKVAEFCEKPDLDTAKQYIESKNYYWNSGMFAFKISTLLQQAEQYCPDILKTCQQVIAQSKQEADFLWLDKETFSTCMADSIDYAIMEKTDKAVVIPLDAGWNDVGSWSSLWDVLDKDQNNNAIQGDVLTVDTTNSYLHAENKLITTVGVSDLIVVETDDAVMIAAKDKVQDVKNIVKQIKQLNRTEADTHQKVIRPWGHYDSVDRGERHQAKRIMVKPGGKLSLQSHHHRAEHWIVVKGTALVYCESEDEGENKILLKENESTFIPIGMKHSLENPGVIPLEIIEVQTGSYLGEDDIVRYEDIYGRVE